MTDPLIGQYVAWQEWRNLAHTTRVTCRRFLGAWAAFCAAEAVTISTATREHVEGFLTIRDLSARSRSTYLSRLGRFYTWAVDEGHVELDPTARVARPRFPSYLPRPISNADLEHALATASTRTRAMLSLAAYAGLRVQEIAGIRAHDLLLSDDPPSLRVVAAKGGRERMVPLHPVVVDALSDLGVPATGYVFHHTYDGGKVTPGAISERIGSHLRDLGIPASAHCLRHWFGTHTYRASLDLRVTQELLGHRSPSTTAIYTQIAPGAAAKTVALLPTFA